MGKARPQPRTPVKRRFQYTAVFKLNAIALSNVKGNRGAAAELGINEACIRRWKKQEGELVTSKSSRKSFRGPKCRWPELEDELEKWVKVQREGSRGVSTTQLRLKAREIAEEKNLTEFSGGYSWCCRFLRRKGLSIRARTTMSQQLPADFEEKMDNFRKFTADAIAEYNIDPSHIINMDEVPLTFDLPLQRTVAPKGESTVNLRTTGNEKTHFTCVLGCTAAGQKLPPMVIFKRITMPREEFPRGVVVRVNQKGRLFLAFLVSRNDIIQRVFYIDKCKM